MNFHEISCICLPILKGGTATENAELNFKQFIRQILELNFFSNYTIETTKLCQFI